MRSSRTALLALLLSSSPAWPASFDCAKAATPIEHMICADAKLSTLDEQLAKAYGARKAQDRTLARSQRDWLAGVRDKCASTDCLAQAYAARIPSLVAHGAACPISREQLIGDWTKASGEGFEEVDFMPDADGNNFQTWLHHAPEVSGRWDMHDCKLHVTGSGNSLAYDFVVEAYDHGNLKLRDADDSDTMVMRKTPMH
jgi:uncharacterized protein YecT (DUF1311 family)